MSESKGRKTWFSTEPVDLILSPSGPLDRVSELGDHQRSDHKHAHSPTLLQLTVAFEENRTPVKVSASDTLFLTIFSRRAVIDFGIVSTDDHYSVTRFLLLENPHDEPQWVSIQRGLPETQFYVDWISSECDASSTHSRDELNYNPMDSVCVPGRGGRYLLRLVWNQASATITRPACNDASSSGTTVGFHHVIQFRVNDAYSLQALVIGRFMIKQHEARTKTGFLTNAPHLPSWARTSNTCRTVTKRKEINFNLESLRQTNTRAHRQVFQIPFVPTAKIAAHEGRKRRDGSEDFNFIPSPYPVKGATHALVSVPRQMDYIERNRSTGLPGSAAHRRSISQPPTVCQQSGLTNPSYQLSAPTHTPISSALQSPRQPEYSPNSGFDSSRLSFNHRRHRSSSSNCRFAARSRERPVSGCSLAHSSQHFLNSTALSFVSPALVRSPSLKDGTLPTTHRFSLANGNLFYPDLVGGLSEHSEYGLMQWLNSVFAPCIAANGPAAGLSRLHSREVYCVPGTATFAATVSRAAEFFRSHDCCATGNRLEREVDEGKIMSLPELSFRLDNGSQRWLRDHFLSNYTSTWLHLALDAISAESENTACAENSKSVITLSSKLHAYLFLNQDTAFLKPRLKSQNGSRDLVHNRHAIKRCLFLIWFLDQLKNRQLLPYDPCLFRYKANFKSSAELLVEIARNFLNGEINLARHLSCLGARTTVTQTALDEYQFGVSNLAVDLRDGIRLVKLAQLLIPPLINMLRHASTSRLTTPPNCTDLDPAGLMHMLRFPAISRLQKVHNVDLALRIFRQFGNFCMANGYEITARDIVDGHRERSLTLLWCLLLRYQVLALVDAQLLENECTRLYRQQSTQANFSTQSFEPVCSEQTDDYNIVHVNLLKWANLVGQFYGLQINGLDESFVDGRAFCMIVYHYLPMVLPKGLVRQHTTISDSSASNDFPIDLLIRNNRFNWRLFHRKLSSYFADVPILLTVAGSTTTTTTQELLPPGLVLATLAYLANRLILLPTDRRRLQEFNRDHAARILQTAWRRFQVGRLRLMQTPPSLALYQQQQQSTHEPLPHPIQEQAILRIQCVVRCYLARQCIYDSAKQRYNACIRIQRWWRFCIDRRHHRAACKLQRWWRRAQLIQLSRCNQSDQVIGKVSTNTFTTALNDKHLAASVIQRFWRTTAAVCFFRRRRKAAVCIQSVWRGYRLRSCLSTIADSIPKRTESSTVSRNVSRKFIKQPTCDSKVSVTPSLDHIVQPAVAKQLIPIRTRLKVATQKQTTTSGQRLFDRVLSAVHLLLNLRTLGQILDALKSLELCTGFSRELCFWLVSSDRDDFTARNSAELRDQTNWSASYLHKVFLALIHVFNRSVPHEDILLALTGTLLNIARHRELAGYVHLWWPSSNASRWLSSIMKTNCGLGRAQSVTRLSCGSTYQSSLSHLEFGMSSDDCSRRKRSASISHEADSMQISIVEWLTVLLLRLWRSRKGTLGIRLFTRICCVLVLLCESVESSFSPLHSFLPVIQELSDCLSRRQSNTTVGHFLRSNPVCERPDCTPVHHSTGLLKSVQSLSRLNRTRESLRSQFGYEFSWQLYPVRSRPDPMSAIDLLLLTVYWKTLP